jgi:UDP-N-acetylmuramate dehydrogenase
MNTQHHVDLAQLTTFHVHATAETVVSVQSTDDVIAALQATSANVRILGGGSNILVGGNVSDVIVKMEIMGRDVLFEDDHSITIRFGAGESWHESVSWCVEQGYGGLENLALIPGTVGAAPMQNIGAYGVEQERCFDHCIGIDRSTLQAHTFRADACAFGYRDSVFKRELRDRVVITHVAYTLSKQPTVHCDYADVRQELEAHAISDPAIADIFRAVVAIRSRKLPDPSQIGNAGSFFKNPVIAADHAARLHAAFPTMPSYPQEDGRVKLPAAWLIDQCGWKGHRRGDAGVHVNQALVLVNYGAATGEEIHVLASDIERSVRERFDVSLETEVNRW